MKDPRDGSAMWGENRIFSIAWGSVEAVTSLSFLLDLRNAATWSIRVPYGPYVADRPPEPLVLGTAYPKQLLQLIDRYCLKSGGLNCAHPVPPLLRAETCNVAHLITPPPGMFCSASTNQNSLSLSVVGVFQMPKEHCILGVPRLRSLPTDNLPNAQIDCSASTTTNLSEPFYGNGVTVLEAPSPDNLPNTRIVCSASTTTNFSEPFHGTGVPVLQVASSFAPQHVLSSLPFLITRNALHLQPNFSEVSRGESVVIDYDKCLPTHWSAQPPPRLMPELPEEALASLQVPRCRLPWILRRILQH